MAATRGCGAKVRESLTRKSLASSAHQRGDVPSRAEAIRRMVELAAKMKKKPDADR